MEAEGFRDRIHEFYGRNVVLFGVSTDTMSDNLAFKRDLGLPFSLLSDTKRSVCLAYGTCAFSDAFFSERTTYVIDEHGIIRRVFQKVQPNGHADEVLQAIDSINVDDG